MKTLLPKCALLFLAAAAISLSSAAGQTLEEQKSSAEKIAISEGKDQAKAKSIAEALGNSFGAGENSDALLQIVEQMCSQNPNDAAAVAAAATAFNSSPDFAARLAAAAAQAAPSAAAAIAGAVAAAVPSAATAIAQSVAGVAPTQQQAIAEAVINKVPGVDPIAINQAVQEGSQTGSTSDSDGTGGGSAPVPTAFGGGGGGATTTTDSN